MKWALVRLLFGFIKNKWNCQVFFNSSYKCIPLTRSHHLIHVVLFLDQAGDSSEVSTAEEYQVQSSCVRKESVYKGKGQKTHIQTKKCKLIHWVYYFISAVWISAEWLYALDHFVCALHPQPIKAPESVATIITSESVFHKVTLQSHHTWRWSKRLPTAVLILM